MSRFTSEHGWPLYLATLSYGAISIRHSTAPESPMSFEAAGLNLRRPVLTSALGRAWLAFCPEEERRTILRDIGGLTPRQETALGAALEQIRRDGYAFTRPARPTRLHGIAVAIRQGSGTGARVMGSLSMRFPSSAMTEEEVGSRFGRRLQQVARAIASDARVKNAG
jgi:IclR family mhp operon transcriptional activator